MDFPRSRIRDPALLKALHLEWRECALCGETWPLSLHHINRHPRDDVEANLVMLCGDGVRGCHGLIEARDTTKQWELAFYIKEDRPDTLDYLERRLRPELPLDWIRRTLGA